ncbi:MAG: hypothetical protein HFH53_05860 [Hespellia sp.]|nr:hypothetical protein [Hespellia sp.]
MLCAFHQFGKQSVLPLTWILSNLNVVTDGLYLLLGISREIAAQVGSSGVCTQGMAAGRLLYNEDETQESWKLLLNTILF